MNYQKIYKKNCDVLSFNFFLRCCGFSVNEGGNDGGNDVLNCDVLNCCEGNCGVTTFGKGKGKCFVLRLESIYY